MNWVKIEDDLPKELGPRVLLWADFGDKSPEDCSIGFLLRKSHKSHIVGVPPAPMWSINSEYKTWPTHWKYLDAPESE